MSRPYHFTDEQLARMCAWRRSGRSYTFIAQRMGCSAGAVRHRCLMAGAFPEGTRPRPSRHPMLSSRNGISIRRFTAQDDAILLNMVMRGVGPTEIGRALDRSPGTIRNRLLALTMRQRQHEAAP